MAGIDKEVGYRFLRDRYLELRRGGMSAGDAVDALGFRSRRVPDWEALVERGDRHHLRVDPAREQVFWAAFESGADCDIASRAAGVSRSTGYRWMRRRFRELRANGVSLARCTRGLRLTPRRAEVLERDRRATERNKQNAATAAHRHALHASEGLVDAMLGETDASKRRRKRADRYWQLMREGVSNVDACRLLGMSRPVGTLIRKQNNFLIPSLTAAQSTGRYLTGRKRVQIADLLRLGCSMRQIGRQLGRQPSTISRELRRHRDPHGNYLPRTADHDAHQQRARPKTPRLVANGPLRRLVQRKLNRCWSPEEIAGWLRNTYPGDATMQVCHETIYRALLLRERAGLHKRYASKLRTGRRIRKTRWRTRTGQGSRIRNMTMRSEPYPLPEGEPTVRQPRFDPQQQRKEGDLVMGKRPSAIATLVERQTRFVRIVPLPDGYKADAVRRAVAEDLRFLPPTLRQSLTWDRGREMAEHQELAADLGLRVYFCDPRSPWQRGSNENTNRLLRQYLTKGDDLNRFSLRELDDIAERINTRPRRVLGWDTAHERFWPALQAARQRT